MTEQVQFTITEAAKLAGISRQTLYRNYINTGVISVTKIDSKVHIELTELIRVFPNLSRPSDSIVTPDDTTETMYLTRENELLREQLQQAKEREEWLKLQLEKTTHLLEDKAVKRKKFLGIF